MIDRNSPSQETVREARFPKRTQFDMIEQPERGWHTRHVRRHTSSDAPPVWQVELGREEDGATVAFENESLYVAWARATEAAHMMSNGLTKGEEA